jgi:hypothetical protein
MLEVSFVRHRGSRDRVYVKRSDGTSIEWDFPSYGDGLPHDLCHLVVEDSLELSEGFWGLVDQHVDVVHRGGRDRPGQSSSLRRQRG